MQHFYKHTCKPIDRAVSRITRKVHPQDLGRETSELEEYLYGALEKFRDEELEMTWVEWFGAIGLFSMALIGAFSIADIITK